jgi:hypothetical protein
MSAEYTTQPITTSFKKVIHCEDSASFSENYNRASFMFSHNLAGHPLFEVPRLMTLANTIASKGESEKIFCGLNDISVQQKWGDWSLTQQVSEALRNIQESKSWVLLVDAQVDPEYAALLEQIIIELEELTRKPLRQEIVWLGAYVFIASPHSITPYHIDSEVNFLFQICGDKDNSLFDPNDRSVLSEQEIEKFYMGNVGAATYQEENQAKATVYHLTAGKGVHQPPLAPHWVQTGDHPSVALSVLFYTKSSILQAQAYQANHFLRKLGLQPSAPEKSRLLDLVKTTSIRLFSKRNPKTKAEIIRSGVTQINSLISRAKRFVK